MECLWYNGEMSCYDLLEFNPKRLSNSEIRETAWRILAKKYGFFRVEFDKVMETLYLLDSKNLKNV